MEEREILKNLLAAREERALTQNFLLNSSAVSGEPFVVQISLNVPGWPKRVERDEAALSATARVFVESVRDFAPKPAITASLTNAAGIAVFFLFAAVDRRLAAGIKKISVSIEETLPWGRAVDIDVIAPGGPVSRPSLSLTPRKCLLCGDDAKACARTRAHPAEELRGRMENLIRSAGDFL
jgi:holo-ACP synthase CitX